MIEADGIRQREHKRKTRWDDVNRIRKKNLSDDYWLTEIFVIILAECTINFVYITLVN